MITPESTLILARMLQDFCSILLWGGFSYLSFLVPKPLSMELSDNLRPWYRLIAIALMGATLTVLPFMSADFGDGWHDAWNTEVLQPILFQSTIGMAWLVQTILVLALLVAMTCAPKRISLIAVLAGLFLSSRSLIGHAVMLDAPTGIFLQLNYIAHVLSAGAWVGALLPLLLVMRKMSPLITDEQKTALRKFSSVGHIAVLVAITSGVINATLIRGRVYLLESSPYDAMLTVKITIVAAMVLIAITNRYLIVPRLAGDRWAATALAIFTGVEFLLAGIILIVVNLLSAANPH